MSTAQAVRRGIALMDEKLGPGWEDRIDRAALNLGNVCDCVVGQVFDCENSVDYMNNLRDLGLVSYRDEVMHGFATDGDDFATDGDDEDAWAELDAEWQKHLTPKVTRKPELVPA